MQLICERLGDGAVDIASFDCGIPALNLWFHGSARDSDGTNLTRTWIWHTGDRCPVAYYTIAPYFIERHTLSKKQARGLPDRIPCYLLARLALDQTLQGQGLGSQLLASALVRMAAGASNLRGRFVVVDAIDEPAAAFYRHHGFVDIPGVPSRLVLSMRRISGLGNAVRSPGN